MMKSLCDDWLAAHKDTLSRHKFYQHFGAGPDGKRCKHCAHCYAVQYANTYYKCDLRANTSGPKTDIRANWPACGKFEEGDSQ